MSSDSKDGGIADLRPLAESRAKEQKAWYWYDWANSAYFTTILTVLFGPYMIAITKKAAPNCHTDGCVEKIDVLGVGIAAGSLGGYLVTFSTLLGALVLPLVGAIVDRSPRKKLHMAVYAWIGSIFAGSLYFMTGDKWQIGAVAIVVSNIMVGCSLVSYSAILVDIAYEDERDRVSSRGWAFGYLGGGLLLAINLVMVLMHKKLGMTEGFSVRLAMLSAALWWAVFTVIPFLKLRNRPPRHVVAAEGTLIQRSFGQLAETFRDMKNFPVTLTFLLAYLFYNDGIQTVIGTAAVYGEEELNLGKSVLIGTILLVQFVAFGGALLFGKLAETRGSIVLIRRGVVLWMGVVIVGFFLPANQPIMFMLLAVAIGIVMGGTQALSRSFFSLLIPRGREGEYFSLYQALERGTSWFGSLVFYLMYQLTGSYRPSIIALIVFFGLGTWLLAKVDAQKGIREAGNSVPQVL
jgi:UMF1 family MFS transporter